MVGESGSGLICIANAVGPKTSVLVNPGQTATLDGWIIFYGGISLYHPDGDTAALGDTFALLNFNHSQGTEIDSIKATGTGVCNGYNVPGANYNVDSYDAGGAPFLHMGGPRPKWGGCTGSFSGPPH